MHQSSKGYMVALPANALNLLGKVIIGQKHSDTSAPGNNDILRVLFSPVTKPPSM
jgi:hypothetical protein